MEEDNLSMQSPISQQIDRAVEYFGFIRDTETDTRIEEPEAATRRIPIVEIEDPNYSNPIESQTRPRYARGKGKTKEDIASNKYERRRI